jgi:hypothetical protein
MCFLIGELFIYQFNSLNFETRNYGLLPLLALLMAGAIYTIYKYFRSAPAIELDNESITFNHSSTYLWKDLEKVELTGKRPYLFLTDREGVLLKFKDQKERVFLDKMYENSPEMKTFIEAITSQKPSSPGLAKNGSLPKAHYERHNTSENTNVDLETMPGKETITIEPNSTGQIRYFKGFPLFCFHGIMWWGLIVVIAIVGVFGFLKDHHAGLLIMPLMPCAIFFIVLSRRSYYFGVSDDIFFVKSHYLLWIKNEYPLDDIREIVFEQQDRMPITLRIINKDFTTAKYPAASLWSKTWMELKAWLEQRNVKVRNECVTYEPFEFKFFNDD